MNREQENKTYQEDGIRPIDHTQIEIANTFDEDGNRPIEKSPDFLMTARNIQDPITSGDLDADQVLEIDGKRPVDNSYTEVVNTFEDDGERPIMANKYQVVDTLDIDGQRPITSN
ncbi:MAG: hypothetical protein ACRC2S_28405 [Waterburya sp.]